MSAEQIQRVSAPMQLDNVLHVLSASHERLSAAERAVIAAASERARDVGLALRDCGIPSIALATCHRFEIYWWGCASQSSTVRSVLLDRAGIHSTLMRTAVHGDEALRHLMAVSGGLRSMRRGEPEILGQVRSAWQAARTDRTSCAALDQLAQGAIAAGRHLRRTFEHLPPQSIGEAAVTLLTRTMDTRNAPSPPLRMLLVGAGAVGRSVAAALPYLRNQRGVSVDLLIANRTESRAAALASDLSGRMIPWSQWRTVLGDTDIAVFSARSPVPLVARTELIALAEARTSPAVFIDLAAPANLEDGPPLSGITQYSLADLADDAVAHQAVDDRAAQALDREVRRFQQSVARREQWMRALSSSARHETLLESANFTRDGWRRSDLVAPHAAPDMYRR